MTDTNIFDRLLNIDARVIYIILMIGVVVPLLNPLGLPIPVSEPTRSSYNLINSLPAGSIVLVATEYTAGSLGEVGIYGAELRSNCSSERFDATPLVARGYHWFRP